MSPKIRIDRDRLARFCQEHGIRRFALFGSVLRDDFRPDSDVDALVEFELDRTPDLFTMAEMQLDLSELFGRRVDLRTAGDLSRDFRQEVLDTAEVQYLAS
jgi:predicted nucleotidyltransferase